MWKSQEAPLGITTTSFQDLSFQFTLWGMRVFYMPATTGGIKVPVCKCKACATVAASTVAGDLGEQLQWLCGGWAKPPGERGPTVLKEWQESQEDEEGCASRGPGSELSQSQGRVGRPSMVILRAFASLGSTQTDEPGCAFKDVHRCYTDKEVEASVVRRESEGYPTVQDRDHVSKSRSETPKLQMGSEDKG